MIELLAVLYFLGFWLFVRYSQYCSMVIAGKPKAWMVLLGASFWFVLAAFMIAVDLFMLLFEDRK